MQRIYTRIEAGNMIGGFDYQGLLERPLLTLEGQSATLDYVGWAYLSDDTLTIEAGRDLIRLTVAEPTPESVAANTAYYAGFAHAQQQKRKRWPVRPPHSAYIDGWLAGWAERRAAQPERA